MTAQMHASTPDNSLGQLPTGLWDDESGQDIIEYALVAAALGLFTVAGVHGIANAIIDDLKYVVHAFNVATGQP